MTKVQYSAIFERLAVIGWFSEDLDPMSLYMDKERGLAEDFCKLWWWPHCYSNIGWYDCILVTSNPNRKFCDSIALQWADPNAPAAPALNSSEQDVAECSADVKCNTELIGLPVEILTKIFTMKVGDTLEVYSTLVGIIE